MTFIDAKTRDLKTVNKEIKESVNGVSVVIKDAAHLHGLAAGLKEGEILIEGEAGDYLAVLNAGATIETRGNVGKYLADNMNSGTVIISGNTEYGAGMYTYGGTLVIHGNTGDFTATMNKGATIIVAGDVGDEAATYMLAGDFIVVGNAGSNFANFLIRGNVYIGGEWQSLGHNTRVEPMSDEDLKKLQGYFKTYAIDADAEKFKKIVAASLKPFYH
jgi:glutamate synthase domain-containing protein 3